MAFKGFFMIVHHHVSYRKMDMHRKNEINEPNRYRSTSMMVTFKYHCFYDLLLQLNNALVFVLDAKMQLDEKKIEKNRNFTAKPPLTLPAINIVALCINSIGIP